MNKIILVLFGLCSIFAASQVQGEEFEIERVDRDAEEFETVRVERDAEAAEEKPDEDEESSEEEEEVTKPVDEIKIKVYIPGLTSIANTILTKIVKKVRKAIGILGFASREGAEQLGLILSDLEKVINSISGFGDLPMQIPRVLKIASQGMKACKHFGHDLKGKGKMVMTGAKFAFKTLFNTLTPFG